MTEQENPAAKYRFRAAACAVLAVVAVAGIVAVTRLPSLQNAALMIALIALLFISLGLAVIMLIRGNAAALAHAVHNAGFTVEPVKKRFLLGDLADVSDHLEPFARWCAGEERNGHFSFAARRDDRGKDCRLLRLNIQRGKTSVTYTMIIYCFTTEWPLTSFSQRNILSSLRRLRGDREVSLKDHELERKIFCVCSDPDFALLAAGPPLVELALQLNGITHICMGYAGIGVMTTAATAAQFNKLLDLAERVHDAIPPELSEWKPSDHA